jgi:hypothetical protein
MKFANYLNSSLFVITESPESVFLICLKCESRSQPSARFLCVDLISH